MKKIKASSRTVRLIAFLLIATVLICIVGFSAEGWQPMTKPENDSDKAVNNSGEVDNNKGNTPTVPTVKYYDYLTGEEISEDMLLMKKSAFVMSSSAPMYGISAGDLVIEFPTEKVGESRLLVYTECINTLGKIGSIAPTRAYISSLISSFGGILIANGVDDSDDRIKPDLTGSFFDLAANPGYSYSEYMSYMYSNHDLIKAGLSNNGFSAYGSSSPSIPYIISKDGGYIKVGDISAKSFTLSFSESCTTDFSYSAENKTYVFAKNGNPVTDLLYNKDISYKNVFVLFADSVTYESEDGAELVLDMSTSGRGYYIRDGVAEEINWKSGVGGAMLFTDKNGEALTVGVGNSYIGFMKSSQFYSFKLQ